MYATPLMMPAELPLAVVSCVLRLSFLLLWTMWVD